MKKEEEKLEIVRGSGNVWADLGYADANIRQAKDILAEILFVSSANKQPLRPLRCRLSPYCASWSKLEPVFLPATDHGHTAQGFHGCSP